MASTPEERQSDASWDCGGSGLSSLRPAVCLFLPLMTIFKYRLVVAIAEPLPIIVTPTLFVHQKIKATGKDTGLVRDASFCRSQLPKQATPLPTNKETTTCDNPFLSPPNNEPFCDVVPSVAKGLPNSSEETPRQLVSWRDRVQGINRWSRLLTRVLKPGLAPSTTLDKLGFEPLVDPMIAQPPGDRNYSVYEDCASSTEPSLSPQFSFPNQGTPFWRLSYVSGESSSIEETDVFNDKGDQASVVGHVPDAVLAVLIEGFKEIDEMVSKLAARVKMPFHQVSDRYIRLHSHSNGPNLWNTYSMYFAKNMDRELAHLPKGDQEEYKDTYSTILETWKEAKELENMGGTVAQRQQLFDKTKRNLNHTFTALSKAHGFEGTYLLAGRVVNQDGGLGHCFHDPRCREELLSRLVMMRSLAISRHMSSEEFYDLAALFANCKCSNMVSLQAVHEVFETPRKDSVVDEVEEISDPRDRTVQDGSEEREDHEQVKHRLRSLFEEHRSEMGVRKAVSMEANASSFSIIRACLGRLARGSNGISDLTRAECSKLLAALNDTGDGRLHIRSVPQRKAALISSEEPVIIGGAPPPDSNKSRGKRMFCNLKTDRLGPKRLLNKAATRVKKKIAVVGSVGATDEIDMPEDIDGIIITSTQRKKRPSIIEISSNSISASLSDYKPMDENGTKGKNTEDQDSHNSSVDSEYEQLSSSCKCKLKATTSSHKLKIISTDDSAEQKQRNQCIPSPQLTITTSDEESAPRITLVDTMVEPSRVSIEQHAQPSTVPCKQPSSERYSQPSVERRDIPSSVELPNQSHPCDSSSDVTMKEAGRECSETRPLHPKISLLEVEMTAAPRVVEQKTAEVSVNVPGDTQTLLLHNNQYQRPKPRPAVNRSLQNSTEDAFSLRTRYHPARFPAVNATGTLSVASAQLLSAEEDLVDKTLEGDTSV
ncbi:hypothetical protein F5141DRAFT_1214134 [Pisolithus sp. B1]|nr:hypothetical protein F5141DRAFT_1214134 [Pisolithus sp. B1]